jgi:L-fuconolactonase
MPDFPIIDTHLHVWDQTRLKYSAFDGHPLYGHPYHVEDFQRDCGALQVEAMVFLECYADFWPGGGQYLEEVAFVEDEARRDPRLRAIVAMAPLEWGRAALPILTRMRDHHPLVKGIRRIVEFDADPRALTLSDDFVQGVNLLNDFGYSFDINVHYTQMDIVRDFVPRVSCPLILDHCGKPGIRQGAIAQYRDDMATLSRHKNLSIKLSDLPVTADPDSWTEEDLRPYIAATIEAFGPDRVLYGGDYPICLAATSLPRWVEVLDRAFADLGLTQAETRAIYRDNANRFYRMGL